MKIKFLFFILSLSSLIGCSKSKTDNNESKNEIYEPEINSSNKDNFILKIGQPYFQYDEIDYYNIDIEEDKAMDLYEARQNSSNEKLKYNIILNDFPKNLDDINFVTRLNDIGFKKSKINSNQFEKINDIFVEKNAREAIFYACIAVYRDILIFKKNKKIIGVAKICFDCSQNHIVGTKANTENFGQDGDYEKLAQILKK